MGVVGVRPHLRSVESRDATFQILGEGAQSGGIASARRTGIFLDLARQNPKLLRGGGRSLVLCRSNSVGVRESAVHGLDPLRRDGLAAQELIDVGMGDNRGRGPLN